MIYLLQTELHSYDIFLHSLKLLSDYFKQRRLQTKKEWSYSSREAIEHGVTQWCIIGPFCSKFFFAMLDKIYFASYTDDK